jgi:signal transduction histidine kinase
MDDATATAIFRVVQESLTNVVRHAQASEVTISLRCGDRLLLRVEDNGRGFNPAVVRKLPGLGLLGMRERILALGGTLKIDSELGIGTTLAIELPLSNGHDS